MVVDFNTYQDVIKITLPNLIKLSFCAYISFIIIPKYIFPQKYLKNKLDITIFNIICMTATILTIIPLLVFLHIFSYISFILSLILIKAILMYTIDKENLFLKIKKSYPPLIIKILNKLDDYTNNFIRGKYKNYKPLISFNKILSFNFLKYLFISLFLIYAVFDINLINIVSLNNKTSDVSQFIEWVVNLDKNILYATNKTAGADFFGLPVIIFFFHIISNIDPIILFSLYPIMIFIFILLVIYYVVIKITDSYLSAIFAIVIYVLYCLSPISNYITGNIYATNNPNIINIYGLKIYFYLYNLFQLKKDLIDISNIPYIRINSGLGYEISASFFLLNLYFLTMSLLKKENIYLILYSLTLYIVFVVHGGGAILLTISSIFILINAILFGNINLKILKKGIISIFVPVFLGNTWILSWLKYGIPQDFGEAAPFLDKLFKTKQSIKSIVKVGKEFVDVIVYYKIQLLIFLSLLLIYPISLICYKNKRFLISSMSLSIYGVLLVYNGNNLGLPPIVAQSRCANYLFLIVALGCGIYFNLFEKIFKIIFFEKFYQWAIFTLLVIFTVISIVSLPTYNDTKYFFTFTNSIQYNSIALALYKIKKTRKPFTYTVVSFVQTYSKIRDKGFHINVSNFLQKYNPYSPNLEIESKYIYIVVEHIPNPYKGLGEWYYRWRKDLEDSLMAWIDIYSKFHDNIKIFYNNKYVTIYEIDNREYMEEIEKKKKNLKKYFQSLE